MKSLFATTGFTAVMAQRREPPDALDYFPTPPWATRALFRHVLPAVDANDIRSAWEPACGEGHMAAVIEEFAAEWVIASDVFDYGFASGQVVDFLNEEPLGRPEWIITNPPFVAACEFTLRALGLASEGVAMLVRTQWIEGIGRYEKLFRDRPPTLYAPFVERVPMVKGRWDPAASTATSYAWFIWRKGASGSTRVLWIPPGCRRELARPDDAARFAAWSLAPADAPLLDYSKLTRLEDVVLPVDAPPLDYPDFPLLDYSKLTRLEDVVLPVDAPPLDYPDFPAVPLDYPDFPAVPLDYPDFPAVPLDPDGAARPT